MHYSNEELQGAKQGTGGDPMVEQVDTGGHLTPGSPMKAHRRRLPRVEWDPRQRHSVAEPASAMSGLETRQRLPGQSEPPPPPAPSALVDPLRQRHSGEPKMLAVPIQETSIGMKRASVHGIPGSAGAARRSGMFEHASQPHTPHEPFADPGKIL